MTISAGDTREHRTHLLPNGNVDVSLEIKGDKVRMETKYSYGTAIAGAQSGSGGAEWRRCSTPGCFGEAILNGAPCFAHVTANVRRDWLRSLAVRRDPVLLRGIELGDTLLAELLESTVFDDGAPRHMIFLDGADISADLRVTNKAIRQGLTLQGARIFGAMYFHKCEFQVSPVLTFTTFDSGGPFGFQGCKFETELDLSYCRTNDSRNGVLTLVECECAGSVKADGASTSLSFARSRFMKGLSIRHTQAASIHFDRSIVDTELDVAGTSCKHFNAHELRASSVHKFGPIEVDSARFSFAQLEAPLHVDINCKRIDMTGARFAGGGAIDCNGGELIMNRVTLGSTLRISGRSTESELPKIVGLRDSDAGAMSFGLVDMTRCLFAGAHNLGNITLEPTVIFPFSPGRKSRACIADEFAWRAHYDDGMVREWNLPGTRIGEAKPRDPEDQARVQLPTLNASQVAGTYRELRRSLEAHLDAPRAADFYYGEMEMRRRSATGPWLDRAIITLYWCISGYGLSVGKAIWALIILIALGSVGFAVVGFEYADANATHPLLAAVKATLPGFEGEPHLSHAGEWIRTVLRVLGPVLYALLLLAVRSRVVRKP